MVSVSREEEPLARTSEGYRVPLGCCNVESNLGLYQGSDNHRGDNSFLGKDWNCNQTSKQTLVALLYAHTFFESVAPWEGPAIADTLDQMQTVEKLAFLVLPLVMFHHGSQNLMAHFCEDVTYQVHCRRKTCLVENAQLKER